MLTGRWANTPGSFRTEACNGKTPRQRFRDARKAKNGASENRSEIDYGRNKASMVAACEADGLVNGERPGSEEIFAYTHR